MAASTMRRRRPQRRRHWWVVAGCLALAFAPLPGKRRARALALELHRKVARAVPLAGGSAAVGAPTERERLLAAEVVRLKRALLEANSSSELVRGRAPVELIPAEVLPLAGGADALHRVALARGRRDGVEVGLPVIAGDSLVGRVAQVAVGTCEVVLVTDPSFRVRASIARAEGEVEGLLRGDGSETLAFEPVLLKPDAPLPAPRVGEAVTASRASRLCGIPAVLGVVERVERPPGLGLVQGRVRPLRALLDLERVVVVKPKDTR